jgi:hypothetical protein
MLAAKLKLQVVQHNLTWRGIPGTSILSSSSGIPLPQIKKVEMIGQLFIKVHPIEKYYCCVNGIHTKPLQIRGSDISRLSIERSDSGGVIHEYVLRLNEHLFSFEAIAPRQFIGVVDQFVECRVFIVAQVEKGLLFAMESAV